MDTNNGNSNKNRKNIIAYEQIKAMIMNNELKSGDLISENQLAARLKMSRTPIREAIKGLSSEGLVDVQRGIGIRIKHVTLREMHEIYPLRNVLEAYAIQQAAERLLPQQLDEMTQRWLTLREKICNHRPYTTAEILELDEQTHAMFINHAGNETLKQLIDTLKLKIHRFQMISTTMANNDIRTVDQHIELIAAIKAKNLPIACRLLEAHFYAPWEHMLAEDHTESP
ncbi:MAG: GntR family transcriptional regulator [Clostridiales bacterium]